MKIALTVAGSDSGGGAGIQADLKTFHQFGVFGTSAIVAVTAQNTRGVRSVHPIPSNIVADQLDALAEDLPPAALKTGMLATAELALQVAQAIEHHAWREYVLDPVMVATSGDRLLSPDAETVIRDQLVPLAAVITPNLHEAEILTGVSIGSVDDMVRAGTRLLELGSRAALIKAGHQPGDELVDVLVLPAGIRRFPHPRIATTSTHGSGCTLSAAITACLALEEDIQTAVARAIDFVTRAIVAAPGLGGGSGPLNHLVPAHTGEAPEER
jgi:hydroxymethylpyrimidine/phosphomethylpyrimidine kinase